ncbi:MAG: hypothetical protein OSB19_11155 [Opitutaceae bacterium]|nr:hypothetical protein [Opitutaceae bacterium]
MSRFSSDQSLRSYPKAVGPFAQWEAYGPEGTITDDTLFKLIFFNTLKANKGKLTQKRFAQAVLDFRGTLPPAYQKHYDTEVRRKRWATNCSRINRRGVACGDRVCNSINLIRWREASRLAI